MISLRSAFYFLIILLFSASLSSQSSLYSPEDPLWELNASNFNEIVFGKSNAWIIEFYNSWCGHCIRFAPTWKEFAKDTQTWKSVVDVGAVNCNDKENTALCRQYDVQLFPTIKLFWHHVNESDLGMLFTSSRDISTMESAVVSFLESHWSEGVPPSWPSFEPFGEPNIQKLAARIPQDKKSVLLFIEHPDSFVGRKILLDLSNQKHDLFQRVLSTSELLNDLKSIPSNQSIPALIKINSDGTEELLMRFTKDDNDTVIRDTVFKFAVGGSRNEITSEKIFEVTEESTPQPFLMDNVYMTDLENAVYYSLSQEVGMTKNIEGEKISALKAYLYVLANFFPGSQPVMEYLTKLYNWVSYKKRSITGEEFVQAVNQNMGGNVVLSMKDWVGCKGSESKYRGYPCSLWTLFHTLTVAADQNGNEAKNGAVKNSEVLYVIRDYVKNFFTCEDCADHFLKMAENVENEVKSSTEAVIWLWRAHNAANRRLAGDITEDPKHPKIQFPSIKACPGCQKKSKGSEENVWDETEVLRYLHQFYGRPNILILSNDEDPNKNALALDDEEEPKLQNSAMVNTFQNVSLSEKWTFQWFTNTDISLCVSLYLVSAVLLIIIFFLFRQRRRKRKFQFGKYLKLYQA